MIPIPEVDGIDVAFGGGAMKILPPYKDIPKEFKDWNNKWVEVVSTWFFSGIKNAKWKPKPGVETGKALRVIKCCIGSFEPSHEHKEAGCAYLLSQWFDDVTYEKAN